MAKKVGIDGLGEAIQEILLEYGDSVHAYTGEIIQEVTKKGTKAVKQEARANFGGTGEYASGWTSKYENDGRLSKQGIIYNAKVPGLPHLLEHGHAKRNGGRVSGRIHIEPIQEMVAETGLKLLKDRIV